MATATASEQPATPRRRWYSVLYIQVLVAILVGIHRPLLSQYRRSAQAAGRRLHFADQDDDRPGDILHGGARHRLDDRPEEAGRVGVKTLVYFEAVSSLALVIGLIVGELVQPGKGFDIDASTLDPKAVAGYVTQAKEQGFVAHLLAIIPDTFIGAFAKGDPAGPAGLHPDRFRNRADGPGGGTRGTCHR